MRQVCNCVCFEMRAGVKKIGLKFEILKNLDLQEMSTGASGKAAPIRDETNGSRVRAMCAKCHTYNPSFDASTAVVPSSAPISVRYAKIILRFFL